MIFRNSKFLLVICSVTTLLFIGVATLSVYSIQTKNKNTSELIKTADRVAGATVLTSFVERMRTDERDNIEELNNLSVSNDKLILFIESIEGAGLAIGVETQIDSVDRIDAKKSGGAANFRIVVQAEGSWQKVFSFLQAIEYLPYRVTMEEINLSKAELGWQLKILLSVPSFN
jgi:hypothetical protein